MYAIIIYDAATTRVHKYQKLIKQYLFHVQNSAFEGEITRRNLKELLHKLNKLNINNEDSVIIYTFENSKYIKRRSTGEKRGIDHTVL